MNAVETEPVETLAVKAATSIETLLRRAEAGDTAVLPDLRAILQQPAMLNLLGNLAARVEDTIIAKLVGRDLAFQEALRLKLATMRSELAGPNATPLERQLVERIVVCWLAVYEAELRVANAGEMPIKQADYMQRRIDHANRRYLQAVKTLAVVRKLAVPVILAQVNIAKAQTNVNSFEMQTDL